MTSPLVCPPLVDRMILMAPDPKPFTRFCVCVFVCARLGWMDSHQTRTTTTTTTDTSAADPSIHIIIINNSNTNNIGSSNQSIMMRFSQPFFRSTPSTMLVVIATVLVCLSLQEQSFRTVDAAAFLSTSTSRPHQQQQQQQQRNANPSTTSTTTQSAMSVQRPPFALFASSSSDNLDDVRVMVNGMPGPMATAAAEACLRKGLNLSPVAMTGPDMPTATIHVHDPISERTTAVKLIPSSKTEELEAAIAGAQEASKLIAIDYTHPSAVNGNGKFYVKNDIPFVMGTTGGDRDQLLQDCAEHYCVIAPNMGKQIVAMQAALEDLASKYPAAFGGYTLEVTESHQKTKADTSGTAKAVVSSLQTLMGSDHGFSLEDDIKMLRDDESSQGFGVPEEGLDGHAFHTYTLTSPDKSVQFELKHNVVGRSVYAEGTADAVKFLTAKMQQGEGAKVYTMINVLEQGALE